MNEQPISFLSDEQWLSSIIHRPAEPGTTIRTKGVLIVVGGPQTRVGSHRQFLLLARRLVAQGYFVMRFDYHGMGDSEGCVDTFLNTVTDIENALIQFQKYCPEVSEFVLWGLCDAASAILLYCQSESKQQLTQLVLLNPWVTTKHLKAKVMLKHYYLSKLIDREFWRKVFSLEFNVLKASRGFFNNVKTAITKRPRDDNAPLIGPTSENYVGLMRQALDEFRGAVTIILSGEDLVAAEFELLIEQDNKWKEICRKPQLNITKVELANHTFASAAWREVVENITLDSLRT